MGSKRIVAMLAIGAGTCVLVVGRAAPVAGDPSDPEMGRVVFIEKQCARCHLPRGERGVGPALDVLRRPQGEMELAGRLWNHVPAMAAALDQNGFAWPPISSREMGDLMAYLRAEASRDPAPDLYKGQVALLRKGCLKCHSLRREGGRVEPDLAARRADYESAAAWAATMWTHTPRMAAMASERAVPYPRFSGDEMGNLLGFLRSAAR